MPRIGRLQKKETMVELDGMPVILPSVAGCNIPVHIHKDQAMLMAKRQMCVRCVDGDST